MDRELLTDQASCVASGASSALPPGVVNALVTFQEETDADLESGRALRAANLLAAECINDARVAALTEPAADGTNASVDLGDGEVQAVVGMVRPKSPEIFCSIMLPCTCRFVSIAAAAPTTSCFSGRLTS